MFHDRNILHSNGIQESRQSMIMAQSVSIIGEGLIASKTRRGKKEAKVSPKGRSSHLIQVLWTRICLQETS